MMGHDLQDLISTSAASPGSPVVTPHAAAPENSLELPRTATQDVRRAVPEEPGAKALPNDHGLN